MNKHKDLEKLKKYISELSSEEVKDVMNFVSILKTQRIQVSLSGRQEKGLKRR